MMRAPLRRVAARTLQPGLASAYDHLRADCGQRLAVAAPPPPPPCPPPKLALNDGNIKAAVQACLKEAPKDGNCVKSAFGPMACWDVSAVTDMHRCAPYSPLPLACLRERGPR